MKTIRVATLMIALVLLLAGLWAGLLRLGWALPLLSQALPISHGPLLISGFFGTLISLERAVALGKRWAYVAPLLAGLGGLSVLISGNAGIGPWLLLAGSLWLLAIFYVILRRHAVLFTWFLTLGALCWVAGNALWLSGRSIAQVLAWWICFLVLTIAAERLELGRLLRLSARRQAWFVLAGGACVLGSILTLVNVTLGVRILGVGLFTLAVWLLRNDIARKTVRQQGLPRFIAICLLTGYTWLAVSGLLAIIFAGAGAGPGYDAMLHSLLLGFVIGVVFAHAPIILPGVLSLTIVYHPILYLPWIILQVSLLIRLLGDLLGYYSLRQWGGMLNAIAILTFLACMGFARLAARERSQT